LPACQAPMERTLPTPVGCSVSEHRHTPSEVSLPHARPAADPPTPGVPYPSPFASSFHPPAHNHPHPKAFASSSDTHRTQKPHNRHNPTKKIRQVKLLIRRMEVVTRQPKPHHPRRDLQSPHKTPHDRNRPASTYKHRLLAEHRMHRLSRSLHIFV